MLLLVCMAMYGLEIDTELATPDHEDLHGVAPKQTSFSGLDFVGNGLNVNDELAPFEQKMPGKLQSADGQARQRAVPPQVRIDAHGVFKYVLLELEGADDTSVLVRGTARFNFHKQNVQEAQKELGVLGLPPYVHLLLCCSLAFTHTRINARVVAQRFLRAQPLMLSSRLLSQDQTLPTAIDPEY